MRHPCLQRTASARGSALGGAYPAVQVTPRLWSDRKMTTPFATPLQAPTPNSARAHSRWAACTGWCPDSSIWGRRCTATMCLHTRWGACTC